MGTESCRKSQNHTPAPAADERLLFSRRVVLYSKLHDKKVLKRSLEHKRGSQGWGW